MSIKQLVWRTKSFDKSTSTYQHETCMVGRILIGLFFCNTLNLSKNYVDL